MTGDLKPENILFVPNSTVNSTVTGNNSDKTIKYNNSFNYLLSDVKLIDYGSACIEGQSIFSYIQSRFCEYIQTVILLNSI